MKKGTLARIEIDITIVAAIVFLILAGYALVSALADRVDPKVRDCVAREEKVLKHDDAVKFCKHLQEIGALP
ncbi:MAG: hypothetical protein ISS15_05940 [Alphaproteobacteria bacterium]|nr:hypothetical protein [Alphaproteobacteria bacterium]MBL6939339.1 hypothetical protein [Alphaproteobacteria bacterium]MBL7097180.1 hypothetical protein [Alphaproteobacteria bacterium]